MCKHGGDTPPKAFRLVKDTQLSQHRRAVVIDHLAGKAIIAVESEDSAQRKFDLAAGCGKSAPGPEVPPTDDRLQNDAFLARMSPSHVDLQIGHCVQQLRIKFPNLFMTRVMRAPWLVIIAGLLAKGSQDAIKIVRIFKPDMLLYELQSGGHCAIGIWRHHPAPCYRDLLGPPTVELWQQN